jgi:hypothetical protein
VNYIKIHPHLAGTNFNLGCLSSVSPLKSRFTKEYPGSTMAAPLPNLLTTLQPAMSETIADRVRRELWERKPDGHPRDQDEGGSLVVVWDRITLQELDEWLEKHESELPKWD